jgi:hypothetical protein
MAAAEQARYWIALFGEGGEKAGIQRALGRHKELKAARSVFRRLISRYQGRLIMLCDRATYWPAVMAGLGIADRDA